MVILSFIYLQMFQLSYLTRMPTLLGTEIQSPLNVQSPQTPPTQVFTGRGSVMESPRLSQSPTTTNTLDPPSLLHHSLYLTLIVTMKETIFVSQPTPLEQVKVQEELLMLQEVSKILNNCQQVLLGFLKTFSHIIYYFAIKNDVDI